MKTMILTLTLAAACGVATAQSVPERRENQQERIAHGVRSGELTRGEASALRHQQRSIHEQVIHDRHDGAGLTAAERARAQARQNHASRDIRRLKHNGRTR
jgi:hypothetical protein